MKRTLWILIAAAVLSLAGCKKDDTINCTVYWQLYAPHKYLTVTDIEQAFQQTFFGYYDRVNDNTVRAMHTTPRDVRSITLKLASMADALLDGTTDPAEGPIEVRVFIDFAGSYIDEVWSKTY
ncbi:MAG: hypothetical protein IK126_12345 [Bacteroidales bacterium]|nr:hypothetical protein [Bacteroidales bacterium]MBR6440762.1 hypothetical protein [Bacteroidales bacterium]